MVRPKKEITKTQTSITMDPDLKDELDKEAKALNMSKSQLIELKLKQLREGRTYQNDITPESEK